MKKVLTTIIILSSLYSWAQQDPYFTHFKDVLEAYNPAAAGHEYGEICISGLTHHQWRDYTDQTGSRGTNASGSIEDLTSIAPVTYNLNVNTIFKLNEGGSKYIGAGLTIIDDKIGYTKSTAFRANINYRQQFQGGFSEISGGLGLGAKQWGWDKPKYIPRQNLDPKVPISGNNATKFDLSFGAMYKQQRLGPTENFYAGFSVTNLSRANYIVTVETAIGQANIQRQYVPHYYTVVGADIKVGGLTLEPAILAKYGLLNGTYRPQIDLNVTTLFAQTLRGGLAYRQWGTADALSLLVGYQRGPLKVGYAYDVTLSNVQAVSNGTHEIFVRYCIPINFEPQDELIKESVRFL